MDDGKITALVLLDLSAAFATVDHKILLSRLQYHLGIHDIALDWCKSYHWIGLMFVLVTVSPSCYCWLLCTQGSVLGPQWFTVYTFPVCDIIWSILLNYHVYGDDTQLYITFKVPADSCITTLEKCIQEIRSWMRQNFLKLNTVQARNLGDIFDSTMTLKPHISNIVRVSSFHIRNIGRIRKYLNQSAAEQIVHAFVTSQLDNRNAYLYGLPQNQISRLQHIQNAAARVVTLSRKSSCHITPILNELHRLSVFNLMLIVHKSFNNIAPIYIEFLHSITQFAFQQHVTLKGTNFKTDLGWQVFFCSNFETLESSSN